MSICLNHVDSEAIFAHALDEVPVECCGILLGTRSGHVHNVSEVHRVANVWDGDRRTRFMVDARTHLRLQREGRERGLDIVGFYHSHPTGKPEPSAFDSELAWPEHSYLIVSLQGPAPGQMTSWRLNEASGRLQQEPLEVLQTVGGASSK